MPVGDSLTWGTGASGGYRLELKEQLVPARYSFDFVGSINSGPFEIEDRQHEGNRGYRIDELSTVIEQRLLTYRPQVVLLMIGTNDVLQNYDLATASHRLATLVDQITATLPTADVLVASIPPLADPLDDEQARAYNAEISGLINQRAAAGEPVRFVDIYPAISSADHLSSDGVHLNAAGYKQIADTWMPGLTSVLATPSAATTRSCPCSLWNDSTVPATPSVTAITPTEVGLRFRSEQYGQITGIRFYKGPQNTGTHRARLWGLDGTRLASTAFTGETEFGWQLALFSTPVTVRPNTTYVASYFAPNGGYSASSSYFTDTEYVDSPLRALAAGQSGGNGWTLTGSSTGGFPRTPSTNSTNFWVDVVFTPLPGPAPPPPPPAAPTNLTAAGVSATQIKLSWRDVIGETGYRIERALAGGSSWVQVGTTSRDVLSYGDTGLAASTSYSYRVVATSANGDSAPSTVATATTADAVADTTPPTAPRDLVARAAIRKVNLSWAGSIDAGGSGLAGYRIWRSTSGATGTFTTVATSTTTSYSDIFVVTGTKYWYRVKAFDNAANESASSNVAGTKPR